MKISSCALHTKRMCGSSFFLVSEIRYFLFVAYCYKQLDIQVADNKSQLISSNGFKMAKRDV